MASDAGPAAGRHKASEEQVKLVVISAGSFWVSGDFEKARVGNIRIGDVARIKIIGLDAPLRSHGESIGRSVNDPNDAVNTRGLPR